MSTGRMLFPQAEFSRRSMDLTSREIGACALLFVAMWKNDGRLPLRHGELQKIARIPGRWKSTWSNIKRFFDEDGGEITSPFVMRAPSSDSRPRSQDREKIPAEVRRQVMAEGCCAYCGTDNGPFEIDHIFPWSRGGTNERSNLALACRLCNRSKSDMTLEEWLQ